MVTVPTPPHPFDALTHIITAGTTLYRVHAEHRNADEFNPGLGQRSRFAPFGDPAVSTLYAAATINAAVSETILHDVAPGDPGIDPDDYTTAALSRVHVARDLRLASLHGLGPRRLGIHAHEVTATDPDTYPQTSAWAAAAHTAGFDGLAWMSRLCNSDHAFILFGGPGRVQDTDLEIDPTFTYFFGDEGPGLELLAGVCSAVKLNLFGG